MNLRFLLKCDKKLLHKLKIEFTSGFYPPRCHQHHFSKSWVEHTRNCGLLSRHNDGP